MSSCPYDNVMKNFSFFGGGADKKVEDSSAKCPYSGANLKTEEKKEEKPIKKEEEVSSDEDEKPAGGCPVMNKSKFCR